MSKLDQYVSQLNSLNENTRQNAAYQLGILGDSKALVQLGKCLNDSSVLVRRRAANALGNFTGQRAVELLTEALSDPDREVYACACGALSKIQSKQAISILIGEISENDEDRCSIVTNNLIKIGELAVEDLLEAYYRLTRRPRAYILKALGRIGGKQTRSVYIDALSDSDYDVFWVATAIQRTVRDPLAVSPLLASLSHEYWLRQFRAIQTLGVIGDKRSVEPLRQILQDNQRNLRVRGSAALCLAKIDASKAIEPLLIALKDDNPDLQLSALIGLSHTGEAEIVAPLLESVNQRPDSILHHNAIKNLGRFGNQKTLKELERLLKSEAKYDPRVVTTVRQAIETLRKR